MVVLGKALNGLLAGDELETLVLANSLFLDSRFEASQGFKSALIQHFKADLEQVNFSSAAEEARNHINCWVANRTANKITELMPQGSVDTITRLVLACAVYFKGNLPIFISLFIYLSSDNNYNIQFLRNLGYRVF